MRKIAVLVSEGAESIASEEIRELIGETKIKNLVCSKGAVLLQIDDGDVLKICYKCHSAIRVLACFHEGKNFEGNEEECISSIKDILSNVKIGDFFSKGSTFSYRLLSKRKETERGVGKKEIEKRSGDEIFNFLEAQGLEPKVELSEPAVQFMTYVIGDVFYFGIDISGKNLSKREYKIFNNRDDIKGTIGFYGLLAGGFSPEEILLDPFCRSGVICIEAAMKSSNKSPHFYSKDFSFENFPIFQNTNLKSFYEKEDEMTEELKESIFCFDDMSPNVNASRKNAKIAGVNKQISFSRIDAEFISMKFEKESVDRIVTRGPLFNKFSNMNKVKKTFDFFFEEAGAIIKKEGTLTLIIKKDISDHLLEKTKNMFILSKEYELSQGMEKIRILVFKKR